MTEQQILDKVISYKREMGFLVWRAPVFSRFRWDIFKVFDLLCVSRGGLVKFIQATTYKHLSDRRKKISAILGMDAVRFDFEIWAYNPVDDTFSIEHSDRKGIIKRYKLCLNSGISKKTEL